MSFQKVIFITGAASGIGYALGEAFARDGARVILSDMDQHKVTEAASFLKQQGLDVTGVKCDVTIEDDIKNALDQTLRDFGQIDVLINNAGLQFIAPIEDFPTEKFELLLRVMLTAPFIATKHVFPTMKRQKSGRIINMASINGLVGFSGKAAYNSAKHGVIGLTKVTALEGAEFGITANAVCPGYVDTPLVRNQLADLAKNRHIDIEDVLEQVIYPLVPQKRLLSVQEIADYVLFLASDKARGVTGQAVVIDGGYTTQ
ncbi:3-hydroxybutyrate dehydrogenase [Dyadobacter sp. LHD-138]|uniref:3-hydroxybutyrate dehydrogenase n=1 Tax=Dyadobacter sp. LHD-138 TaxID=3071413 RepID=UPI0027DF03E0|nr:3-hydroxybutyrate dehydrogenase [Dyadobacter sp. LHD-138]MDQ6480135.1 3-hydroxybutyrate dehydrogenase [Dyadobacter sp. LHD-138]